MKSVYVIASLVAAVVATDTKSNCPPRPAIRAKQKDIFEQAVQTMVVDGKYRESANKFYSADYINHDPDVLPGRNNTIAFLEPLPAGINITIVNKAIEGNFAYVVQKVDMSGSPSLGWTDIWRLEGICIMEHWSIYMSKLEGAANPLPLV